jgi:hypothetical protein
MTAVNSTKISEQISFDDDKLIIKKTHDASHMLDDARYAREMSPNSFGSDYKLIGHVDAALVSVWLKEAGVRWDDTQAVKDVIKRKMMSNEFSALRVWEGTY